MPAHLHSGAAAALLVLGALGACDAGQRALLVGVNDYEYGGDKWDLRGCVNDVHMTRQLLIDRFGFEDGDIMVLVDEQATAAAIVGAIQTWLVDGTDSTDVAYLHFSGHGSQIEDDDGDEPDGLDELLCPVDVRPTDRSTMILDDDLKRLLARIPAASLTTVLDACHSGTGTRDPLLSRPRYMRLGPAPSGATRGGPLRSTPKTVAGAFHAATASTAAAAMESPVRAGHTSVTISGCRADQTAADAWIREGFYAGALTASLVASVRRAAAGTTYGQLLEDVRRDMAKTYVQTPQLEGDADAHPPWADHPDVAIAVIGVAQGRVRIGAGSDAGIMPGTVFSVLSSGTAGASALRATVQVDRVEANWSEGPVRSGAEVSVGDHVERLSHDVRFDRLRVRLEGLGGVSPVSLRRRLAALSFVVVTEPAKHFDLRLQVQSDDSMLTGTLLFDGLERARESAPTAEALADRLRPYLVNAYVVRLLAGLQNFEASFGLSLWGRGATSQGKLIDARLGEELKLRFSAERDCYVALLNVGTDGRLSILFPNRFQPDGAVRAGQVYRTGEPGALPFRIHVAGPPGRELVIALATLGPLDLSALRSTSVAAAGYQDRADRLVREVAAVYAEDSLSPASASQQVLRPATGWASDFVIVETH